MKLFIFLFFKEKLDVELWFIVLLFLLVLLLFIFDISWFSCFIIHLDEEFPLLFIFIFILELLLFGFLLFIFSFSIFSIFLFKEDISFFNFIIVSCSDFIFDSYMSLSSLDFFISFFNVEFSCLNIIISLSFLSLLRNFPPSYLTFSFNSSNSTSISI